MRVVLAKNLNIDPMRSSHIPDIKTLIEQDQVKSVNEKAVEDYWANDILKEKEHMEKKMLLRKKTSMNQQHQKRKYIIPH
jgi:hypothetical protein